MNQRELNDLIDKVSEGTASEKELRLYTAYLNHITSGEEAWNAEELGTEESVKHELRNRIEEIRKPEEVRTVRLWPKIAVAAAALAAVVFGVWFYNYEVGLSRKAPRNDEVVVNDVAPGKNGATITLANGQVIALSDQKSGVVIGSELKYNDGSEVASSRSAPRNDDRLNAPGNGVAQTLTAITAKGQTYQFTLSDGTNVWLNAGSKLEFPSKFVNSRTRNVKLSGEGYFEVAKDKAHPFIVQSEGQEVEVLGTHFNINSYSDELSERTTLLEGSVRVTRNSEGGKDAYGNRKKYVVLKPDEESNLTASGLFVRLVDAKNSVDWKNGKFVFDKEPLESVMRKVARWYNVDIIYDGAKSYETYSGDVSRAEQVSQILSLLEKTKTVRFEIKGRQITVKKI